jgi:pentatricopeptide repeat protein
MGEVLLRSDTKATEFGHLTPIDLELNAVILELFYLSCLSFEYGPSAPGKFYVFEYGGKIQSISYQNPLDVLGYFKNISKKSVDWVLARTLFYQEEKQKRQAVADQEKAKAEERFQSAIEKKLGNLDKAHSLRRKMIKDGIDPDLANQVIGGLLVDQRAKLSLPAPDKVAG